MPEVFLSSVFDPGLHEPLRAACPGRVWDPRDYVGQYPDRSIEDVCRDLIRKSRLFVGVFDERGGRALFEDGIGPVTVLEIELLQALFQRMPIYLFLLPGFSRNRRLAGLVRLARDHRQAVVQECTHDVVAGGEPKTLTPAGVSMISRVIRDPLGQRLLRRANRYVGHMPPLPAARRVAS